MRLIIPMLLLLPLLTGTKFKGKEEVGPRIVGGTPCDLKSYPFVVSVLTNSLCGGILITLRWVLTAAHCIKGEHIRQKTQYVRSGFDLSKHYVQIRTAVVGIRYPKFNYAALVDPLRPDLRYDIGLIMMDKPFVRSAYLDVVKLPTVGFTATCTSGKVLGAGSREVEYFQRGGFNRSLECVDLPIVNISVCALTWPRATLDDTVLCTMEKEEGRDGCRGDSGGPLLCKDVLIGVVSSGKGCGVAGNSATYMNVERFLDFINDTITRNYTDSGRCKVFEFHCLGIILLPMIIIWM